MKILGNIVNHIFFVVCFVSLPIYAEVKIHSEAHQDNWLEEVRDMPIQDTLHLEQLKEKASKGDIISINKLGYQYYQLGGKDNLRHAIETFTLSAEKGSQPAQLALGYLIGMTDKSNLIASDKWIDMAYEYKPGRALYFKYLVRKQKVFNFDMVELLSLLNQAADHQDPFALNELGQFAEESEQLESATALYQDAVKYGSRAAKFNLDRLINRTTAIERVAEPDVKLLTTQAELGDAVAQYQLAVYYHKGIMGVIKNYTQAIKYYQMSASQNYLPARKVFDLVMSGPKEKGIVSPSWMSRLESTISDKQANVGAHQGFSLSHHSTASSSMHLDIDMLYDLFK